MKSIQKVFSVILILIVCSCSKDDGINQMDNLDESINNSEITTRSQYPIYNTPIYSPNELIVKFQSGTSDAVKASLRSYHEVYYYEVCQLCSDGLIELWGFDDEIQLEPKKHSIETTSEDGEPIEVDFAFAFVAEMEEIYGGTWEFISYEPLIVSENSGVTIAVLDTGFDPLFPFWYEGGEPVPMLYNASETADGEELSGWNFVDSDPNPFDDHPGKHGSVITYEFHNILNEAGVPFQILPAKIFNKDGKTRYFDVLCGTYYVLQRANIVQMSFGWYDDGIGDFENSILNNLIEEFDDVIVVTSAGNGDKGVDDAGDDNDPNPHYPSSYEAENIIAVAATNAASSAPAYWSNYGLESVDFWATGINVPFYDYENDPVPGGVQGTSFAAPQIAAQAAIHYYLSGGTLSPEEVINLINVNGIPTPDGFASPEIKVKYDKYYPMLVE